MMYYTDNAHGTRVVRTLHVLLSCHDKQGQEAALLSPVSHAPVDVSMHVGVQCDSRRVVRKLDFGDLPGIHLDDAHRALVRDSHVRDAGEIVQLVQLDRQLLHSCHLVLERHQVKAGAGHPHAAPASDPSVSAKQIDRAMPKASFHVTHILQIHLGAGTRQGDRSDSISASI